MLTSSVAAGEEGTSGGRSSVVERLLRMLLSDMQEAESSNPSVSNLFFQL